MQSSGKSCTLSPSLLLPLLLLFFLPSSASPFSFQSSPPLPQHLPIIHGPLPASSLYPDVPKDLSHYVSAAESQLSHHRTRSHRPWKNLDLDIFEGSMPFSSGQEDLIMLPSSPNSNAHLIKMLSGSAARALRFDDQVARLILDHSQLSGERIRDGNLRKQYTAARHRTLTNANGAAYLHLKEQASSTRKLLMHRVIRPRNVPVPPSGPSPQIHSEPSTR